VSSIAADSARGLRLNPSTYGLFAYFLFTAGKSNPICDVPATPSNAACVVIEKNYRCPFFCVIYCVLVRLSAAIASRSCVPRFFSRIGRPRVYRDVVLQKNRKTGHLLLLCLRRQPSILCLHPLCRLSLSGLRESRPRHPPVGTGFRDIAAGYVVQWTVRSVCLQVKDDLRRVNERRSSVTRSAIGGDLRRRRAS